MPHIELRRMALPEVSNAASDSAGRPADIRESRRTAAAFGIEPTVLLARPLANDKRLAVRLQQRPVAERWNEVERVADRRRDRWHTLPGDLRIARRRAGIATQSRQAPNSFSEHTVILTGKPHMTVVQGVGQRHIETQTHAARKVALFVTVEDDRMEDAHGVAPCVKVQAQRER
jgi:hypothetical protein